MKNQLFITLLVFSLPFLSLAQGKGKGKGKHDKAVKEQVDPKFNQSNEVDPGFGQPTENIDPEFSRPTEVDPEFNRPTEVDPDYNRPVDIDPDHNRPVDPGHRGGNGKGHAYGKHKGNMSGREFGQERAEEARNKYKKHQDQGQDQIHRAEMKLKQLDDAISQAQLNLDKLANGKSKNDPEVIKRQQQIEAAMRQRDALQRQLQQSKNRMPR